nr:hypothetical protein [Geobacter sp. DSM 9736]
MIDQQGLREFCGIPDSEQVADHHRKWVEDALVSGRPQRESLWSESIAVGSSGYVEEIKARLGIRAVGRMIQEDTSEVCFLREEPAPYNADFTPENALLRPENSFYWQEF